MKEQEEHENLPFSMIKSNRSEKSNLKYNLNSLKLTEPQFLSFCVSYLFHICLVF